MQRVHDAQEYEVKAIVSESHVVFVWVITVISSSSFLGDEKCQ